MFKQRVVRAVLSQAPIWVLVVALALPALGCGGGGGKEDEPEALDVLSTTLPNGTQNAFYSVNLFATGGSGSGYAWSLVLGALPSGVSGLPAVGPSPRLSGVPTAAGSYGFTVRLQDSDGEVVDVPLRIVVDGVGGPGPGPGTSTPTSTANAPAPRTDHTAVWTGTEMVVWGGRNRFGALAGGGAYDPATDTWRTVSTIGAPTGRWDHTAVWTGSEMIVFGGWNGAGAVEASGGAWNAATNTWRPLPTTGAPAARVVHSAVWTGTRMIVWGGLGQWPPAPPPPPNSVSLVFNDGFAYDPGVNTWTATAVNATLAQQHAAVWTGSRMVVWGGQDNFALSISTLNTGGNYDPGSNTWTATDRTAAPAARTGHSGVWSGSELIVWGGTPNGITRLNSGGRFRPNTNTWQATPLAGAPTPRSGHTAVWTGTEMVVWAGFDAVTGIVAGGGAYRPGTNTWRAVPAALDPSPRLGHTAIWTGAAMIVWGGLPGNPADVYFNTGAVINP